MGSWSTLDDGNDLVADAWIYLRSECLTKKQINEENQELEKNQKENNYNNILDKNNKYILNNTDKLYKNLRKYIKKNKKYEDYKDKIFTKNKEWININIVGICMTIFKICGNYKKYKIPLNFPKDIKHDVIKALIENYINVKKNPNSWKDINERIKSLKFELKLFNVDYKQLKKLI